jgi:flagellar P-ring protein precursor FlgI
MRLILAIVLQMFYPGTAPSAVRLKDLASFEGMRENQLVGYGLVVGLNGTGDRRQTVFSTQSLANMLQRMGVSVDATAITVKNTASVLVTGILPPFAQPGTHLDVTAAAIGDASNLQGGLLILTSLRGPNGQVYAVAQGSVVTGGFVAGKAGNSQTVNHPTTGRVPNGAIVERAAPSVAPAAPLHLQIHQADFTTASRIVKAISLRFGSPGVASALNSALISVNMPPEFAGRSVEFISELESLTVEVDRVTKVVVNERTGTIVMGKDVQIAPVAILQGGLSVEITTSLDVSQPAPFAPNGKTEVIPQVAVDAKDAKPRSIVLRKGATVEELMKSLAAIGSTARDVIAILQSLKAAGALEAELEVI